MNIHQVRYERFIEERKRRVLPPNTKIEKHHIIPKSLGGSDDSSNIIELSIREHYIAHLLLWKACGGKMSTAFHHMVNFKRYKIYLTSRQYEELRKDFHKRNSGKSHPFYGKTHNASARLKLSKAHKGKPSGFKGKSHSKDARKKITESLKGNEYRLGKLHTEDAKKKISESISGEKNPFYGKSHSDETRKKMSECALNRSEETKEKLKQVRRSKSDKIILTPYGQFDSIADAVEGINAILGENYVDRNFIFTSCISKNENLIHPLSQERRPKILPKESVGNKSYRDLGFGTIKKKDGLQSE